MAMTEQLRKDLQIVRDHLDRVVDGEHEIGNLCIAITRLADIVEDLITEKSDHEKRDPALAEYDYIKNITFQDE